MNKEKASRKKTIDDHLATLRALKLPLRTQIVDFLDAVIWDDYDTEEKAMADIEQKLRSRLTPEQWEALLAVLKVLLPILLGLL